MSDDDWLSGLAALMSRGETSRGEPPDIRNLLFGCHQLIQHGGHRVHSRFEALSEAELSEHALAWAEDLTSEAFQAPEVANLDEGVRVAANFLRALEKVLIGAGQAGKAPRSSRGLEVRYGDAEGWLLPFAHRFRSPPKDWPPYFAKRGLTRFRCISRNLVSGLSVDLQLVDVTFSDKIVASACLFEELHLLDRGGQAITAKTKGPFVVSAITGRDPKALEDALAACCVPGSGADLVIFPELAITPDELKTLKRLLRLRAWDRAYSGPRPRLVLAGSWHHALPSGDHVNRAPVLNAGGDVVGHHEKHMVFGTPQMREGIVAGDKVLVLASPTLTVAVAICLDFCQTARANPYDELDVDMVLVTSLANETTVEKHKARANGIWDQRKTATFLGQQIEDGTYGFSGAWPDPEEKFADRVQLPVATRKFTFTP